jgi:uncharacterized pyridoxal phosphate-dependent enzyme
LQLWNKKYIIMLNRRQLLKTLSAFPLVGAVFSPSIMADPTPPPGSPAHRDYFKELGLRTFINAAGTYTALTGCLMPEEVTDAIKYASRQYVNLVELQQKAGDRIAEMLQCEGALVTAGAASAITLGTAAVLTGKDKEKIVRLPGDMSGMKTEVIIQKAHRIVYDHAIRNCGITLVEVETREELEAAINDHTAMMWFLNTGNDKGQVKDEEFVAIGRRHGIPTFNDCAADVPPVENLWKYTKMGFDLVCFSGGKGIRGPQSTGLLLGRKELTEAALLHAPPNGNAIGRGMKVNKEEVLAQLVALELFLSRDQEKEWARWEKQINLISDSALAVPGVETEIHVPPIANHVPSLRIRWDQSQVKTTPGEVRNALRQGHPSIETVGGDESVDITTWMMNPGEERIVARRVREELEAAS